MDNTISPTKSAIQFGVLFGCLMIIEFMISYILDIDPSTNKEFGIIVNILNFLVFPILFISIGANHFKNKLNSGLISFGQTLKIGVIICLIAGLLYAIFSAVFNMIFPEFVEEILRKTRSAMIDQNPNMTNEQIEMAVSWTKKFMSPALSIPVTIIMYAFIGLIYSLIIGAIIKKDSTQSY
jgi:energy-converting hydrogenase Eha subunit A